MIWGGVRYQTQFVPGGEYTAVAGEMRFDGAWWIEKYDGQIVLNIHETRTGQSSYTLYRVWLDRDWKSGSIGQQNGGTPFRIEP